MRPIENPFVQDLKNLSRKQRHDFMNNFQIIYGYLQLDKKEKAVEQIKEVTKIAQNISKLHNLSIFSVALILERKLIQAYNKGINLNIEVETHSDNELRQVDNELELIESIEKVSNYLLEQCDEDNEVTAYLKIIEYSNYLDIVILDIEDKNKHIIAEGLKKIHEDTIVKDEIVIRFKFDEVTNLHIKESIYSKIYSNTI